MMRTRSRWLLAGLLFVLVSVSAPLQAVGTVTVTGPYNGVYAIAWTSNASGAVSGNSFSVILGEIKQVKFVPASGGTQPTDQYDVTLVDADGLDVLNGMGANLSNAAPALITSLGVWTATPAASSPAVYDLVVANAGNAKSGTVYVMVKF